MRTRISRHSESFLKTITKLSCRLRGPRQGGSILQEQSFLTNLSLPSAPSDQFQIDSHIKREDKSEAIYLLTKTLGLRLPQEIKVMVDAIAPLFLWLYEYALCHSCPSSVAKLWEGVAHKCTTWTIHILCPVCVIIIFSFFYVVALVSLLRSLHFCISSLISILYVGCLFSSSTLSE